MLERYFWFDILIGTNRIIVCHPQFFLILFHIKPQFFKKLYRGNFLTNFAEINLRSQKWLWFQSIHYIIRLVNWTIFFGVHVINSALSYMFKKQMEGGGGKNIVQSDPTHAGSYAPGVSECVDTLPICGLPASLSSLNIRSTACGTFS